MIHLRLASLTFSLLIGFIGLTSICHSQELNITTLLKDPPEEYSEAPHIVYQHFNTYRFDVDRGNLSAQLEATRALITLNDNRLAYYTATSSFSHITKVSGSYSDGYSPYLNNKVAYYVTPYEVEGIFHSDFFINSMVSYGEGRGVYKFQYVEKFEDYRFLGAIRFSSNRSTPTINSKVTLVYPNNLDVEFIEINFDDYEISKEITQDKKYTTITYTTSDLEYNPECEACPADKFFEPHLIPVFKGSTDKKGVYTHYMDSTDDLYKWYSKMVGETKNDPSELSGLLSNFKDLPTGLPQIEAVYEWVRDNVRYIAFEDGMAGFRPDNCQNVFEKKYGDCKGMANLSKQLLVELGYDARLVWIGTKDDIPYDYSIPSLVVDNHMITAVFLEDERVFLDATEEYGKFMDYAYRIQGRPVLIENGEEFIVDSVPNTSVEVDQSKYVAECSFVDGKYSCKSTLTLTGEPKKQVLYFYDKTLAQDREKVMDVILNPYESGNVDVISINGLSKSSDSLSIQYSFSSSRSIIETDDRMLIDIDFTSFLEEMSFDSTRKAGFHFGENYLRIADIKFDIPEGYQIEHIPASIEIEDESFRMTIIPESIENSFILRKTIEIYDGVVKPSEKKRFVEAHAQLLKFYNDRLILSKQN